MRKKLCVFLMLLILCTLMPGCYDSTEIDEQTYVIAIGLDKGSANPLRMTLQYAIPASMGGGSEGGGGKKSLGVLTLECPTLYAGLNMANNFVGKKINLAHAKAAVFSKEMAMDKTMMQYYLNALIRGREFRPTIFIAVSRGSAEEYIKSVEPIQEVNPAKYYELAYNSYKYTGFSANTQLQKFYHDMVSTSKQSTAILVGVGSLKSSNEFEQANSTFLKKGRTSPLEGDYKAGDIPKSGDIKSETMGLAVFDGLKMVGELDGQDATYYLMVTGDYNYSIMSIPDPQDKKSYVVLKIKQSRFPVSKVQIIDGKPKISVNIILEADFNSIQSGINYEKAENIDSFEKAAEEFLKDDILNFLNRTSKEYHSDICGFGKSVRGKFLLWKDWEDFNWLSKYKDSEFDVHVDLKVRRTGLIIRSMPASSTESGGK